jgi:DNA/RNA-binding domain of Phe-tRNA-synthetase-like protein
MEVTHELPGWSLVWCRLEVTPSALEAAAVARARAADAARARFASQSLVDLPVVAEVRRLFRAAGTDPTRYRPSSEALLRRVLKGDELPAIHPLVDLNNCLSIALAVPSCIMPEGSFAPPIRLRVGRGGERFDSLRGSFDLEGMPVLEDAGGPFGTPISDSLRVAVGAAARGGWMVVYFPAGERAEDAVQGELDSLSAIATWRDLFVSGDGPNG